jgi:biopolymer transport protein ExbD
MKFKHQQHGGSQMPEVNLVPMMDVVMTVLTFFIVVSMTLTSGFRSVNVALPSSEKGVTKQQPTEPLLVALNQQGQLFLGEASATPEQMAQKVVDYLNKNPEGVVILKADKQLPYEKVVQVLGSLRDVGGDRVSLAIGDPAK